MATILCVLYPDSIAGYPPEYALTTSPCYAGIRLREPLESGRNTKSIRSQCALLRRGQLRSQLEDPGERLGYQSARISHEHNTFNNGVWYHLTNGDGWVSFPGVRAAPTTLDPTGQAPGGPPAPTLPQCKGALQ